MATKIQYTSETLEVVICQRMADAYTIDDRSAVMVANGPYLLTLLRDRSSEEQKNHYIHVLKIPCLTERCKELTDPQEYTQALMSSTPLCLQSISEKCRSENERKLNIAILEAPSGRLYNPLDFAPYTDVELERQGYLKPHVGVFRQQFNERRRKEELKKAQKDQGKQQSKHQTQPNPQRQQPSRKHVHKNKIQANNKDNKTQQRGTGRTKERKRPREGESSEGHFRDPKRAKQTSQPHHSVSEDLTETEEEFTTGAVQRDYLKMVVYNSEPHWRLSDIPEDYDDPKGICAVEHCRTEKPITQLYDLSESTECNHLYCWGCI